MNHDDVRVLIVDDEELISWSLARELQHQDYTTFVANTGSMGMLIFEKEKPQVVLLDYRLPDTDGLELLKQIKSRQPNTVAILMTAHGGTEAAVRAIKLGAQDYITKPVMAEELLIQIERGLEEQDLRREMIKLRQELGHRYGSEQIVGESQAVREMLGIVGKVAASVAPSVLVHGESGTGKEMIANALHYDSTRRDKAAMATSKHDLPLTPGRAPGTGLCGSCHQPHQAGAPPLLARAITVNNLDSLLKRSDWVAGSPERQGNLWQGEVRACLSCHHSSKEGQRVPEMWTHPQHLGTLRPNPGTGRLEHTTVSCSTCHDPHQSPQERNPAAPVDFLSGSSQQQICADCHRDEALPRYQYFHDRRRRR